MTKNIEENKSGGISDKAVLAKTGKMWNEWFSVLDAANASTMNHKEIVAYLDTNFPLENWWKQMITVTYEQVRGMREKYQKTGGFSASVSKTFNVPIEELFHAWFDVERRNRWLREKAITIRKATPDKSMRIFWNDNTSVDVNFYKKGEGKTQITIQHEKLPNADAVLGKKSLWKDALRKLELHLRG